MSQAEPASMEPARAGLVLDWVGDWLEFKNWLG